MTQEQNVLLAVLKAALDPNMPLPKVDSCDWMRVCVEAKQQSVILLFYDALAPILSNLPADAREYLSHWGMQSIISNANTENNQKKLISFLQQEGQRYVILKGEASAAYYPNPQLRVLGDVDFLVEESAKDSLHEKFLQQGFTASNLQHSHHITYCKPGAMLEMHFEVAGIPNGEMGHRARGFLKDILQTAVSRNNYLVPSDAHHGLVLLLHMQHHALGNGFGLRHLMDWGCYVNQTADLPFWQEQLLPQLKQLGLFSFAVSMTKTAALAFGTVCPPWAADADDLLSQQILEDVLEGGNLGKKDKTRKVSSLMVSNHGKDGTGKSKLYYLWKAFHRSISNTCPIAEKYPFLYPVFYLTRGVRYLVLACFGKRESLIKALPQANKRRELYRQLHIFEVEKNG